LLFTIHNLTVLFNCIIGSRRELNVFVDLYPASWPHYFMRGRVEEP
jgi:hypothetical protein